MWFNLASSILLHIISNNVIVYMNKVSSCNPMPMSWLTLFHPGLQLTGGERNKQKIVGSKLLNLANNKQRSLTQFNAWLWHETTIWVKIKHKSIVLVPSIIRLRPTWFPAWNSEKPKPESRETSFPLSPVFWLLICRGDWLVFFDQPIVIEETIALLLLKWVNICLCFV